MVKKKTERTFNGQAIHWFNNLLESNGYPFKKAENDIGIQTYEGIRYPDALFWVIPGSFPAGTLIELKPPTTSVEDREMLHTAVFEARGAGVKYFATWNMRETIIWKVPSDHLEILNQDRVKIYQPLVEITSEKDLDDPNREESLKRRAQEILEDLSQLYRKDRIAKNELDSTFFVNILVKTVHDVAPVISQEIQKQYFTNKNFKNEFSKWALGQGIENFEDKEFFETIGRQSVYRLLAKVLFYQALSRRFDGLHVLDPQNPKKLQEELQSSFELVRNIDYEPIYKPDFPDQIKIPEFAAQTLIDLIKNLHEFDFSSLPRDVIGRVFELFIPPEERHSLGQYFTNPLLVDFINSFTVRSQDDIVLDPACGTGTFLTRAYHRIRNLAGRGYAGVPSHHQLLSQLWGTDIAPFPATLAMINLAVQDLEDRNNFPMIFARDFFDFREGEETEIPEPRITNQAFKKKIKLPEFNAIVANPPYIRQEKIEKYKEGYKQYIGGILATEWGLSTPKFSGQADIYVFFFAHAAKLLASRGRLGFVTSNTWLDVEYGYELQQFFLNHFKIIAICESRVEPWFEDAAVNTIVTILEHCDDKNERDNNLVKFVKIKKKLAEIVPYDDKTQSVERFLAFDRLTNKIELAEEDKEDDEVRIRVRKQVQLREKLGVEQKTQKWSIYLRAPDVYFKILNKCKDKLSKLSEIAIVRRGFTTGINEFFYLSNEQMRRWKIEDNYLKQLIKSPKDVRDIVVNPKESKTYVLSVSKDKNELIDTHTLEYIRWGETQTTRGQKRGSVAGMPWSKVPTVRGRRNWYDLGELQPADILCSRFFDKYFLYRFNPHRLIEDQTLYGAILQEDSKKLAKIQAALMNSTIGYLITELSGRSNLGDGVLQYAVYETEDMLIIDARKIDIAFLPSIEKAFDRVSKRPVKQIKDEVNERDRQLLDSIVIKALGLETNDLNEVYASLSRLVFERLELARLRKGIKQQRIQRDLSRVIESVQEEVFPNGVKKFPSAFIAHLPREKLKIINLPRRKLELGNQFFGKYELTIDGKSLMEAQDLDEAEYILFAQREGVTEHKIPADKKEVGRVVADYKRYLKEKQDQLIKAALDRGLSIKDVENLSRQIWGELPEI